VFFAPTDLANFGANGASILDVLRQRGVEDPSFRFHDIDPKTGARRPVSDVQGTLRLLRELSPITHVSADDPPTVLVHGDQDEAVPIEQSRRLVERLSEMKVPARLVERRGRAHAWTGWEADSAVLAEWFDSHLRAKK
jgi:dipeptidyl aminopeptidase/acylaminoacyl peptidase